MTVFDIMLLFMLGALCIATGVGLLCVLVMLIKLTWDFIFDR